MPPEQIRLIRVVIRLILSPIVIGARTSGRSMRILVSSDLLVSAVGSGVWKLNRLP